MWKETKVVKNVSQYNFDARYGVYVTNEGEKKTILHIGGKEIPICEAISVCSYDDKVVVQTESEDGNSYYDIRLYSKDGELLNVVKNTFCIRREPDIRYNNVFAFESENIIVDYANLVDIETGNKIFEKDYPEVREVFDNMIFCKQSNRNVIIRYDWDGNIMWQRDYQSDFNVEIALGDIEGVCGGKLWVKSKYDGHEILLAIDVNTGELIKAFSDSEEDTNLPHCTLCINEVFLNQENGQVLNVYKCVSVIDSNTLNVIDTFNPKEEFEKGTETETKVYYIIGSNLCAKYITYLCKFRDGDQTPSGFFVYNTETRQIEFSTRMFTPKERSRGRGWTNSYAIQCYGTGIICAHEGRDWLHIFEDVKE